MSLHLSLKHLRKVFPPWRSLPQRSFASQPVIPEETDMVVIGGGVMGASTAYHLAHKGIKTVLLERNQ